MIAFYSKNLPLQDKMISNLIGKGCTREVLMNIDLFTLFISNIYYRHQISFAFTMLIDSSFTIGASL